MKLLLILLALSLLLADQKDRDAADLRSELAVTRARLVASEAARIAAEKRSSGALANLADTNRKASQKANENAGAAQSSASDLSDITQQAASAAAVAAKSAEASAKTALDASKDQSRQASYVALITQIGTVLVVIAGFLYQDRKATRERGWAKEDAEAIKATLHATNGVIVELEKNTNNRLDQLLEATGKEKYAAGVKHGESNPKA